MVNSPFLITLARHRDPKLLWPLAAGASVLTHGLALGLIRTLAIQTPVLPDGEMAPLPIQLVALPPDQAAPGQPTEATGAEPPTSPPTAQPDSATEDSAAAVDRAATPEIAPAPVVPAPINPAPVRPSLGPILEPSTDVIASPPVAPAPRPTPAPVSPAPPAVSPAPPRPTPPNSAVPEVSRQPRVDAPPPQIEAPPQGISPPAATPEAPPSGAPSPGGASGQGGQVMPVGLRLDPNGRDIPETAPQLLGSTAIAMQPLASSCGFANLNALLAGMTATSVQMQVRVEPSGEISNARLLQSTGSQAVDDLVSCVVRQRLRLQPASSAGVPQLTDAYILDARIQFF